MIDEDRKVFLNSGKKQEQMRKYDHIFFDLDHTLWDFEANSRKALLLTLEKYGLTGKLPSFTEFLNVYEPVNHQLWNGYRDKKISKTLLTSQRFSMSLEPFGITGFDSIAINDSYLEYMSEQTGVFPGTFELLDYLKTKGCQLYIITNGFSEVQHKKLHTSGLDRYIAKMFVSETVQSPKPAREIFEYALKSCNARKTRSMMVGDSWETDILGALGFGIDQTMFLNNGTNAVPEEIKMQLATLPAGSFIRQKRNKTFFVQTLGALKGILVY